MSIIAITKAGTGQVAVEEFREADDAAAGVAEFVGEYSPPLDAADYVGFDTGFSAVPRPDAGKGWAYDHDTPGMVQIGVKETASASLGQVQSPDGSVWDVGIDNAGALTRTKRP